MNVTLPSPTPVAQAAWEVFLIPKSSITNSFPFVSKLGFKSTCFPPSPLPSPSSRSLSSNKQSLVAQCSPSPVPSTADTWRNQTGQRSQPSRRLCYLDLLPGSPLLPHKPLSTGQLTFPKSKCDQVISSYHCCKDWGLSFSVWFTNLFYDPALAIAPSQLSTMFYFPSYELFWVYFRI